MKKTLTIILVVMITMTSIFAAGTKESAAGGVTTIKLANWDTSTMAYIPALISAFEAKNPTIKVEVIDIPSADYVTKLNVMLNGGSDLDAFYIKEADKAKEFFDKGQLADLTGYAAADKIDLASFNGTDKTFTFDGKLSALPARTDFYVLFYNKDIFDAAGVAYPSNDMTWTEFEQVAAKITTGSGATKKYGALFHTWQALVMNWGVQDGKHSIMDGSYGFFKPYYEMLLRMQRAGTVMDYATLKTSNIHYSTPFIQGNVGMLPMGTWFMSTVIDKIKSGESTVRWGVATIPHAADVPAGYTVGSTTPIAVNNASKKKDAAWKFASFVTSAEGAAIYAKYGQIPATATAETLEAIASMDGMPAGVVEALKVTNISPDRPAMDKVGVVDQMLGEEHSLIMLGENSIDKGLAEMAARFKEVTRD